MDVLDLNPTAAELRDEVVLDENVDAWMKDILGDLTGDDAGYEDESAEDDEDF